MTVEVWGQARLSIIFDRLPDSAQYVSVSKMQLWV